MKFFAALIAKLTGTAEQPKTLDQARATFGEAKSAIDKIAAMFASAGLDLDALLVKGDTALKEYITELNQKAVAADSAALEAKNALAAETVKVTAAESQVSGLKSQVSAFEGLFASIGYKPTGSEKPEDFQAAFNAHVANGVTAKMAELGVKADKLPAASSADSADTLEEIRAKLAACTDPIEAGKLAAQADALRNPKPAHGKN